MYSLRTPRHARTETTRITKTFFANDADPFNTLILTRLLESFKTCHDLGQSYVAFTGNGGVP